MLAYATPADLGTWLEPAATDPDAVAAAYAARLGDESPERLLVRASEAVEGYVLTGYSTRADGTPRDDDVRAWLADAACAQVEFWALVSEQHDIAGVTTGTMSAGGVTHDMPGVLAPRARRVLDRAGLRSPVGNGWNRYRRPFDIIADRYAS